GRWTVAEAIELGVPAPVITASLLERLRSRDTDSFADKLLAAMRNQFGGPACRRLRLVGGQAGLVAADGLPIAGLQFVEYESRDDGPRAEQQQREMYAVNHLRGARMSMVRYEQSGSERGGGDTETHRQLLHGARDGAGAARLVLIHVGVGEGVHAGVLRRREEAVDEGLQRDHPQGRP